MEAPQTPRTRVVVLGASNVALGLRPLLDAARETCGGPIELFAASGRGRSYGGESRFLGRALPSIEACGLWPALEGRPQLETLALATDLGNDIAFGFAPQQVQQWIERALDRLQACGARVVLTGLPLAALERLPPWEFAFWSHLFFPTRGVRREQALAAAQELDGRLAALARLRGLAKVDADPGWYGHDPIHVRKAQRNLAWRTYFAAWDRPRAKDARAASAELRGRLWYERVELFGRQTGIAQPCARLDDGTSVSLY